MGTTETANGKCFRLGDHQPSECVPRCPGGWGHQHDQTSSLTFSTSDEFKTLPSCVNGKCTSPSSCSCYSGWTGPHCAQLCRWWPSSSTLAILMLVMNINLFQEVFFRRGTWGPNCGKGWSKSIFLENKVVVNFDFRHGAKKSGQSGHPFRSYGYLWI